MGGVKFCKDCKWGCELGDNWYCDHPDFKSGALDLVTGEEILNPRYCRDVRADEALCGEHAKWFEPK